ncbi:biotin/lipoate A/B protein ligase family protein [Sphingorhabdus buctiana]|uniref:Biotin/lipoate A/B protein ligase family protein n=1 Tax=Sphingorhabdus buctiana TaxID=1508805 RepID=A0ABW4MIG1_9SPHN
MTSSRSSATADSLWDRLVGSLSAEFPGAARDFGSRAGKIAHDAELLDRLIADGTGLEHLRLWDNAPHLVISKRLARLADADRAAAWANNQGYPVAVRASGGTTVVHRPGVLNVSYFRISDRPFKLTAGFDALCAIIEQAARTVGIQLETGRLASSYCSGSHDIGWRGRKLAGTAGVSRRRGAMHGGVFHASLVVSGDWRRDLDLITQFERLSGLVPSYRLKVARCGRNSFLSVC